MPLCRVGLELEETRRGRGGLDAQDDIRLLEARPQLAEGRAPRPEIIGLRGELAHRDAHAPDPRAPSAQERRLLAVARGRQDVDTGALRKVEAEHRTARAG